MSAVDVVDVSIAAIYCGTLRLSVICLTDGDSCVLPQPGRLFEAFRIPLSALTFCDVTKPPKLCYQSKTCRVSEFVRDTIGCATTGRMYENGRRRS
jgi:hypothetical protein